MGFISHNGILKIQRALTPTDNMTERLWKSCLLEIADSFKFTCRCLCNTDVAEFVMQMLHWDIRVRLFKTNNAVS